MQKSYNSGSREWHADNIEYYSFTTPMLISPEFSDDVVSYAETLAQDGYSGELLVANVVMLHTTSKNQNPIEICQDIGISLNLSQSRPVADWMSKELGFQLKGFYESE